MATIKKSNTTRIFEKNNFGKFLPIYSNENLIEKLIGVNKQENKDQINDFLAKKRIPIGQGDEKVEPALISQLLQSVTTYGKYTNEIINEVKNVQGLKNSFKITYISPEKFKQVSSIDSSPDVLTEIDIEKMLYSDATGNIKDDVKSKIETDNINNIDKLFGLDENIQFPYIRTKNNPGLSAVQVLNPEFRGCFKNSQELDLFFNMISTLDMSMAIPYVNAEFLIPQKVTRSTTEAGSTTNTNSRSYLTASLNNFILGDDYFIKDENGQSRYDNVLSTAKAINGDYYTDELTVIRNSVKTSSTETQTQIKKTYNRQSLNNAIFFAPQTMVNGDYEIANNPNALVDKFRPFMTINNLSFDVRPTKGLLFYKTATMELVLYDKARMSQIAPFIKPELLNTVSSEIILEYGWQSNLGDPNYGKTREVSVGDQTIQYSENPIAEFINSLKVREKYIIVNSSYTINQTGTVNISLSLAMKGPAELRGLSFRQNIEISKVQSALKDFVELIKEYATNKKIKTRKIDITENATGTAATAREVTETESVGVVALQGVAKNLSIENLTAEKLEEIRKAVNRSELSGTEDAKTLNTKIDDTLKTLSSKDSLEKTRNENDFPFLAAGMHDARKNDPFVDYSWWDENLGTIAQGDPNSNSERSSTQVTKGKGTWDGKAWISLGKLLMSILGRRLVVEDKKYDEIQFVFYTLNGKAIQASFLNIASVPVDLKLFESRLNKLLNNAIKLSYEGLMEFILNFAINQKAAAVFGLGAYFKFNDNNSSTVNVDKFESMKEAERKNYLNQQTKSVRAEIFKQYYGDVEPEVKKTAEGVDSPRFPNNKDLQDLDDINKGVFDLTFNVPKVVMNFDSTFHENDPNSSILRISFYDELDNPFESVTELMLNFHKKSYDSAVSGITALRAKRNKAKSAVANLNSANQTTPAPETEKSNKDKDKKKKSEKKEKKETPSADTQKKEVPVTQELQNEIVDNVNAILKRDTADVVYKLIKDQLVILKDVNGAEIPVSQINPENPLEVAGLKTIAINVKNTKKVESFTNMKSFFKIYMPSLTFGQSNSALLSGNITTNQDAKYSTVLLMQQNGEEAEKEPTQYDFELFNQMNNAPMWVIPAQASAQIIGCPIVNFSQLIFLDFNTGTSIDNMYFINGIRHSISPGKFTTDLTLIQKDVYSQFESEASAIAEFFKSITTFNELKANHAADLRKANEPTTRTTTTRTRAESTGGTTAANSSFQINFKINHNLPGS